MRSRMSPLIVFFLLAAVPLAAQDPGEVQLFEDETEVQIRAATKTDIPISKAPGSVTVITHEMIRESGARTIPEIVRLVAGLNIRWNPMVQTIDIRGFGNNPFSSRVLLLIDGVPFNAGDKGGFPQHPGLDFFVLQSVKRLEIVRGPGSALYGENAYWGVLNVVTLSGDDVQGGNVEVFAGDRETGSFGATLGQKFGDDASIFVSAKYLQSQFPMVFWAEEQDSKVNGTDVFLKGNYKGFQMSYYRHEDAVDGFSEHIPGFPPNTSFASPEQLDQTVDILSTKYDWNESDTWSFGGDFSYMRRNGSHCGGCHARAQSEDFLASADHGGQVIGDFRVGLQKWDAHDFLVGVEMRHVTVGDHSEELGPSLHFHAPGTPQHNHGDEVPGSYTKAALYVQDQMSFVNDRVRVTAGFRYDGKSNLFGDAFSPRVAGVFSASDRLILRVGWSSAFRFPNFSELYQDSWFIAVDDGDGGSFAAPLAAFAPNPGLVPEEIQTFDGGAEYRFSSAISAKVDFFRSRVDNFIVLTYGSAPPGMAIPIGYENHPDKATIWGTEVEGRFRAARGFNGFVTWSYQDQSQDGNLVDSTGTPFEFTYASMHKFTVGTYFGPFEGVGGNVEYTWRGEYTAPLFWHLVNSGFTDFSNPPLPSYGLLNVRLNYDLPFGWNGHDRPWRLSFYGKNLTDAQPRETLIGLDSRLVGREFFFGTTFQF